MVHSNSEVDLITAATAQWHDAEIFLRQAPDGINVTDHTKGTECLLVTGPNASDILKPLVIGHDLSKPWLSVRLDGAVAGQPCVLIRVSFAGELGWEIHADPEAMPAIWDALSEVGVAPFGMYALNSMRIEKGYRAWKVDLSTDYSLIEGGLNRFIKFDKPQDFLGKAALLAEKRKAERRGLSRWLWMQVIWMRLTWHRSGMAIKLLVK
ncbi:MAG: dimethylglycine dehydrogenase [Alteromonas macleodii]|jgi:dimethylglycine dehydrogenase